MYAVCLQLHADAEQNSPLTHHPRGDNEMYDKTPASSWAFAFKRVIISWRNEGGEG